jgi:hypothetical protein
MRSVVVVMDWSIDVDSFTLRHNALVVQVNRYLRVENHLTHLRQLQVRSQAYWPTNIESPADTNTHPSGIERPRPKAHSTGSQRSPSTSLRRIPVVGVTWPIALRGSSSSAGAYLVSARVHVVIFARVTFGTSTPSAGLVLRRSSSTASRSARRSTVPLSTWTFSGDGPDMSSLNGDVELTTNVVGTLHRFGLLPVLDRRQPAAQGIQLWHGSTAQQRCHGSFGLASFRTSY